MTKYPFFEEQQHYFPEFDYNKPAPQYDRKVLCDFSNPDNKVGHQQRCVTVYWAMKLCSPFDLGVDIGSTKGLTPYTIHVDKYGNGKPNPLYTHSSSASWADVIADMGHLPMFADNSFPYVASNHSLEHADVADYVPAGMAIYPSDTMSREEWLGDTGKGKYGGVYAKNMTHTDAGVVKILRQEWIRILRPGGTLAIVLPDHDTFNIFDADRDHKHGFGHTDFKTRILDHLTDIVDVVEYNTLNNNFSFNIILRKK